LPKGLFPSIFDSQTARQPDSQTARQPDSQTVRPLERRKTEASAPRRLLDVIPAKAGIQLRHPKMNRASNSGLSLTP